ncbi:MULTISPECIES: ATP-binding cassette domain-containing protein [Aeromonas]|uniref:ATP-binding cassette domain-containing protein n=1 Tax=Aeromonas TaxID=642 RepID=UPI000CDD6FED|nr:MULTISPECIES: ATP-binding cassette domain-containing protein [Aeromonas]AUZ74806.1 peptide ABC transporter ATP-binding protein [Aeromonas sp. ASNIH4]POU39901.1 peptide ABC transporter ATP-binding protein [Aeromonas hydrophila]POV87744.1 peptide ABC transporter ATP-binding protein [Aeromonas sp. ASNIH6]
MLELRNLTIAQGERPLWQGLSLTVKAGARLGISAPSGHGKTTLGRVLASWQSVGAGGQILLDGLPVPEQVKGYNPIQLVPQHPELTFNPYRTTGQALWDVWRPDDTVLARFMVKPAWLGRKPGQLSGGELARIALLRALDPRTRLLIADEVTAQLDPQIQRQLWLELMVECEQRGLAMLVFSHQQALLRQICHRVLRFGEVPAEQEAMARSVA